jgi:hypothetical protein
MDCVQPKEQVGCQAAFASRLAPTENQNQKQKIVRSRPEPSAAPTHDERKLEFRF